MPGPRWPHQPSLQQKGTAPREWGQSCHGPVHIRDTALLWSPRLAGGPGGPSVQSPAVLSLFHFPGACIGEITFYFRAKLRRTVS